MFESFDATYKKAGREDRSFCKLPLVDLFLKREIEFDIQLPQVQTLYESFGFPLYAN